MHEYANNPSSVCVGSSYCGFMVDVLVLSVFTVIFFVFITFIFKKLINNLYLKTSIQTISLILFWLWANNTIFVNRVASWGTFSTLETWAYIASNKIIPIVICGSIYLLVSIFINGKFKGM